MSYWRIAWRNIQQRALASTLTGLSMALGVAMMICVIVIFNVAVKQFRQDAGGYHLIVGPKGSQLELVLNTVYHLRQPIGNLPWSYYKKFTDGQFREFTELAVPYCLGDSYEAGGMRFRVVGTIPALFDEMEYGYDDDGTPLKYAFRSGGRNMRGENYFEAVLGSVVARRSGLGVGDVIRPTHGISGEGDTHDAFDIVGVLEPTGTANDRAVFVNMEGFFLLEGHALSPPDEQQTGRGAFPPGGQQQAPADDLRELGPLPENQREVTAILVRCPNALAPTHLDYAINKGQIAQAVSPTREVTRLLDQIVGPVQLVLVVMTVMIIVVAAIGILVSIYNSMSERSHDIAVMRALGASRRAVMIVILVESILLSLTGGLCGMLIGHGIVGAVSPFVEARTGVTLGFLDVDGMELVLIVALVILSCLVGFLPALTAYRTDVAKSLVGGR